MINFKKYGKRCLSLFLAASMILMPAVQTFAEEETAAATTDSTQTAEEDRETQRQKCYAIAPDSNSVENWPQGPATYADSAIVMDMNSGAVLYSKQIEKKHYPASITKLLTTLVALDNAELTDTVEFSQDSISFLEYGDAHIGMTPGEQISMEDALYAVLLASANEVSYAVAESVGKKMGGGYDTFIQAMNDESEKLGCTGSHWTNANGLHDEQHYTTAHDMARIGAAVYQKEAFRTISQSLSHTIPATNLVNEERTFQQKHKMLWPQNDNYYEYCKGGKTGYTDQARTTLVTMADNGDMQLVAVVLYDFGNDAYIDTRAMFDYAYSNFSKISLKDQKLPEGVKSYEDEDAYIVLPKSAQFSDVKAEVKEDSNKDGSGTVTFTYKGQEVGSVKAAIEKTEESSAAVLGKKKDKTTSTVVTGISKFMKIVIGVVIAVVILLIIIVVLANYRKQIRRRRRKKGKRISAKLRNRGGSVPGKGIWPSDERRVQHSGGRTWRIRKRSFFYYETSGTKGSERSRSSLISFHCNKNPAPEKAGNFPGRQQEIRKSI